MKKLILFLAISLSTFPSFAQQWQEFDWDTINFEEPYPFIVIDSSGQNIWQIGAPNKIFFDSAYSASNAIVTDTVNLYPANNTSYFDLKIGAFNYNYFYPYDIFMEIKHKFDTDTLKDGGYISVSYDEGLTWMNIIIDTSNYWDITPGNDGYSGTNLYTANDTLFNGEFGFSGNSNDWITTWFTWHILPVKSYTEFQGDTMLIRFNFISDSIENNKEGWMIDNIKLYSVDLGGGVNDHANLKFKITPNPVNLSATMSLDKNYKEIELSIFDIQGGLIKQQNCFNSKTLTVDCDPLKPGVYFMKIKTDKNTGGIRKLIIK